MKIKKVLLILCGFYLFLVVTDLNDILYAQMTIIKNNIKGITTRLDLHNYKVQIDAKEIKEIKKNLSGITYNENTKTLFAITNSPRNIYELSLDGEHIRTIKLNGFKDTEGITYIEEDKYAIVDERKKRIYLLTINENTKAINKEDTKSIFKFKLNSYKNFGFEGIAYDNEKKTFFIANEKFPVELIKVSNLLEEDNLSISLGAGLSRLNHFMDDYSGLHFDKRTRHLLFLSDESKSIAEIDMNGTQISFAELEKRFLGLKKDIPQPEGITMDENSNLYIVSEPNLFYKFSK